MLTYADADGVSAFAGSAPSAASRISSGVPDKTGQVCLKASTKLQILTQNLVQKKVQILTKKLVQNFKYRCGS